MQLGPLMLDLEGLEVSAEEREMLQAPLVGGVILFTRNYHDLAQLERLVKQIREARKGPLMIAVDHEGGRVQRFREEFTRLPPAANIAGRLETNEQIDAAETLGWLMAAELRAVDVDFSFAPVLDLDYGVSEVIGDRAFSTDPVEASVLAGAYCRGMLKAGMATTGKHFPGHGAVVEDSHLALPVDHRSLDEIRRRDLVPFARLIEEGVVKGIMPAHVIYDEVDEEPAGFSKIWLQKLLRAELGFKGVIFSDDLNMAAAHVAGSFCDRANLALEAGCDMVLVCNNRQGAVEVLDGIPYKEDTVRGARLSTMLGGDRADLSALHASGQWQQARELATRLA